MTSALYRSMLFWFGLIGFTFLLWAWKDSRDNSAVILWQSKTIGFSVSHAGSLIHLGRVADGMVCSPPDKQIRFQRNPIKARSLWLPGFQLHDLRSSAGLSQWVAIPHWAIVAAYLVGWSLILLWRGRWLRKLSAGGTRREAGLHSRSPAAT